MTNQLIINQSSTNQQTNQLINQLINYWNSYLIDLSIKNLNKKTFKLCKLFSKNVIYNSV